MSTSTSSQSTRLPPELWERVILLLYPSAIPRLRLISQNFKNLIDGSPEVRYQLDLFYAGLEDGPRGDSFNLAQRRRQLYEYTSGWDKLECAKSSFVPLPKYKSYKLEGGILALLLDTSLPHGLGDIHFVRLPSVSKGISLEEWRVHGVPDADAGLAMDPESGLLVAYRNGLPRGTILHFLHMSDGTHHPDAYTTNTYFGETDQPRPYETEVKLLFPNAALISMRAGGLFLVRLLNWRTGETSALFEFRASFAMVRYLDDHRILCIFGSKGTLTVDCITLWDTSGGKPQSIAFHLDEGVSVPLSGGNDSPTRLPRHLAPFSRDHSRFVPLAIRMYTVIHDMVEVRVITSGRLCRLAGRFAGLSNVPWEDWKDSVDVLDWLSLHSFWHTWMYGCRLFLDLRDFTTSHHSIRMYDLSPSVYHQDKSSVGTNATPHASILPSSYKDFWDKADCREISEDNIVLFEDPSPDISGGIRLLTF